MIASPLYHIALGPKIMPFVSVRRDAAPDDVGLDRAISPLVEKLENYFLLGQFEQSNVGAGQVDAAADNDARKRTARRRSASSKDRCPQAYGMACSSRAVSSSGKSI